MPQFAPLFGGLVRELARVPVHNSGWAHLISPSRIQHDECLSPCAVCVNLIVKNKLGCWAASLKMLTISNTKQAQGLQQG